jgi:DUF2924 family protein
MKILAYRIQPTALGGLDKETLRVLRQPKGQRLASSDLHPFEARIATTRDGTKLKAGALLAREWNGRLERVMILDQGFAWNGETYGSLSQVAKAMDSAVAPSAPRDHPRRARKTLRYGPDENRNACGPH